MARLTGSTTTGLLLFLVLSGCNAAADEGESQPPPQDDLTLDLVAVSDGDFLASTYGDGILSDEADGFRDLLTTVRVEDGVVDTSEVEVSNSVVAAPEILDLSPDGQTAYVVERLGGRPPGATTVDELPPGMRLTQVDVSGASAPEVRDEVDVAALPESLDVSPDGELVAVAANPGASVVQLVPAGPDGLDAPTRRTTFDLARLGVTRARGDLATAVQWHPSGRFLAVNVTNRDRVAFFEVLRQRNSLRLRPWGEPVATGTDPFVGRFTPDGRHYLTSNWGRDFDATDLEGRLPDDPSRVGIIRLGEPGAGRAAEHEVLDEVATDISAEGLAVSPDGTLVATVNMRGTALPEDSPEHTDAASVSLLRLDPATSELSRVANVPLDGVLPEGGTFDPSGRYFVATVFEGSPRSAAGPGLQIYRVEEDGTGLTPVKRIDLPHGVHHVVATTP